MNSKRKATLKRRGLHDFVPAPLVGIAVLAYLLFLAVSLYFLRAPLERALFIGATTLNYAITVFSVYRLLYGKKSDPFETHEGRLYTMTIRARSAVYSCIAVAFFTTFAVAVVHNDMQRWMPFALAMFLTIVTFTTFGVFIAPPPGSQPEPTDPDRALP